jgi:hypothetical protein
MTDEMKLLRAFIEASGYEIEISNGKTSCGCSGYTGSGCGCCNFTGFISKPVNYKVTKNPIKPNSYIKCNKCGTHLAYNSPLDACLCGNSHNLERTNSEPLECVMPCVPLPIQSDAWGSVVEYCSDHNEDIEIGINDFATLRPMMGFINRNC